MIPALEQRCWNHPEREASCRCPRCSRSYCRECVTEHESLLLCAACLQSAARPQTRGHSLFRKFLPAAMALAGFILAWFVYYGVGQAFLASLPRPESTWHDR